MTTTAHPPTREYVSSVTSKGQVTIPADIRKLLHLKPGQKVVFRVQGDSVTVMAAPMTLEEAFRSVPPLSQPEDYERIRNIAIEDQVEHALQEMEE